MSAGALRRFWVATHRYLGLATLVFLFVAAVTGCLLCVRGPLDAALNPDLFNRSAAPGRIDPVQAVAALEAARPELQARSFFLAAPPGGNLAVTVAPADPRRPLGYDQVFLDGADGHAVGARATRPGWDARHFVQGVYVLHYTLLAGTWGRWLMGVAALGWLIGAFIGLYLTFPARAPILRGWLRAWTVNPASRIGRLLLDLHQASGLWLLIGVIALAFTSVGMNFFAEAVVPAATALSPAKPSPFDNPPPATPGPRRLSFAQALAAGEVRARARGLPWRPAGLDYIAERNLYSVTFTRTGVVRYEGLGPIAYLFDAASGRFVYEDNPYEDSAGRQVSRSLYPLHTGQVIGAVGMVFIFLAGLSTVEMCVTGAVVWWMRRGGRVAARKAKRLAALAARKAPA
jgi:uncharacterized iron-regulated membrane protein